MDDLQRKIVNELAEKIDAEYAAFKANSENPGNKAGARRARKNTIELTKLMKEYRKISIK